MKLHLSCDTQMKLHLSCDSQAIKIFKVQKGTELFNKVWRMKKSPDKHQLAHGK